MNEWWTSLPATLDQVWLRLMRGVTDRRASARHPALATMGTLGPEARIVVLRGANRSLAKIALFTDLRSAKVSDLNAEPRASLLIWEQKARLQIRLRVRVEIESGPEVSDDWQRVPASARQVYGAHPAPGSSMDRPDQIVQHSDSSAFAKLVCHLTEIETLHLGENLHSRAKFSSDTSWTGSWHAP
jgi:pyridoxamine 5'-phosphate oxidase